MKTTLKKHIQVFKLLYKTITNTTIVNTTVLTTADLKHWPRDISIIAIKKLI